MRDLLLVLNPRRIEECLTAFRALAIDRLWIKNMYESDIAELWPKILAAGADYDRLFVASDDGIPHQHALDAVRALLDDGHPVATGYSNLSSSDFRVNLTKTPCGPAPAEDAYDLYTLAEVMEYPDPVVPTFLAGFSLTGMSVEMWERYPFSVWNDFPGNASDFCLSKALEFAGVPIVAAREAFVWHVKETWNRPDKDERKRLLINVEPRELVLDARPKRRARAKVAA